MNIRKKFLLTLLTALLMLFVILFFTALTISPIFMVIAHKMLDIEFGSHFIVSILTFLTPIMIIFLFMLFFYSKKVSEPVIFFLEWIEQLSLGHYQPLEKSPQIRKTMKIVNVFSELSKKLEHLTHKLKESETEKEKLNQTRRDWTAGVTHDLKTPLSYIEGYSTMLTEQGDHYSEKEWKEMLMIIRDKSIHMKKLIDDMSTVFQMNKEGYPYNPFSNDLVVFLKKLMLDIQKQPAALHHEISFKTNLNEYHYLFDEALLKRALENVLRNSIIHNPEGTEIEMDLVLNDTEKMIEMNMKDNGIGMTKEEQELLFERYYRGNSTSSPSEGTGLGMAISNQIIKMHGGEIVIVSSKKGEGTAIKVTLPINS